MLRNFFKRFHKTSIVPPPVVETITKEFYIFKGNSYPIEYQEKIKENISLIDSIFKEQATSCLTLNENSEEDFLKHKRSNFIASFFNPVNRQFYIDFFSDLKVSGLISYDFDFYDVEYRLNTFFSFAKAINETFKEKTQKLFVNVFYNSKDSKLVFNITLEKPDEKTRISWFSFDHFDNINDFCQWSGFDINDNEIKLAYLNEKCCYANFQALKALGEEVIQASITVLEKNEDFVIIKTPFISYNGTLEKYIWAYVGVKNKACKYLFSIVEDDEGKGTYTEIRIERQHTVKFDD